MFNLFNRKPEPLTDAQVAAKRENFWEEHNDRIKAWRIDSGGNHKSTLFELAVDGIQAQHREDLPSIPDGMEFRCSILPLTAACLALQASDPQTTATIAYLALTKEELEFCDAVSSKKTKKAETKGKSYFCGFRHNVMIDVNQIGSANFLELTNDLTRRVVLGDQLAADFESRAGTAQQWIEQVLRPSVLNQ